MCWSQEKPDTRLSSAASFGQMPAASPRLITPGACRSSLCLNSKKLFLEAVQSGGQGRWLSFPQLSVGVFTASSMRGLSADREISSASWNRPVPHSELLSLARDPWASQGLFEALLGELHWLYVSLPEAGRQHGTVAALCAQAPHPLHREPPALPLFGWFGCLGWDKCSGRSQTKGLGQ